MAEASDPQESQEFADIDAGDDAPAIDELVPETLMEEAPSRDQPLAATPAPNSDAPVTAAASEDTQTSEEPTAGEKNAENDATVEEASEGESLLWSFLVVWYWGDKVSDSWVRIYSCNKNILYSETGYQSQGLQFKLQIYNYIATVW